MTTPQPHRKHQKRKVKPMVITRSSEEDIAGLAARYVRGEIFIAGTKEQIEGAFQVVLLLGGAEALAEHTKDAGLLWEEYRRAGPIGQNGYPVFTSFNVLHT